MDYEKLLNSISGIAMEAALFIQSHFGEIEEDQIKIKSLNSLVSYVDTGAEEILVKGLGDLIPKAGFLTEEETISQEKKRINWIIDPLDGTTNFIHQLPVFSVSIGLEVDGEVMAGVVVNAFSKECFKAYKSGGAFLNDKPISVSNCKEMMQSVIATGFPYHDFSYLEEYLGALKHFMQNTRGIRRFGSAAIDLCYVACGKFDAFFEYGLNPWDVAAGMLIVEEAGGVVSDFTDSGTHYEGKEIIACNNEMFDEFSTIVKKYLGSKTGKT